MSENDKKPAGPRDISDLKARLGLKKGVPREAGAGPRGAPRGGVVPPPPGVAPPQPAQPVVPDARVDPFGAMNAIAAQGAHTRAPEIIVVDKQHVEQVAPASNVARWGKIAAIVLAPLIVGFLLGGINHARSQYNRTLGDAQALTGEFRELGKSLESLNNVLLLGKERGGDGKSYALADKQLVADLEALSFTVPDSDQLILFHSNLYLLEDKLVEDVLLFYSRLKTLSTKVKEHVRLTKDLLGKLPPEARAKLGADSQFGALIKVPTAEEAQRGARPSADIVLLGLPVCGDGKPAQSCPDNVVTGLQVRTDTTAPPSVKQLASGTETTDRVIFLRRNGVLSSLLEGSARYLDELQYYQRLGEIDALVSGGTGDGGLIADRAQIEERLNRVAQQGKAFAL